LNSFDENKAQQYWARIAKQKMDTDPTRHGDKNRLFYDVKFIEQKCDLASINNIIDLGAGSGQLSEALFDINSKLEITCVEKHAEFISLKKNIQNIKKINKDILKYHDEKKYDLILLFGVINSLSEKNEIKIYELISDLMHKNSIFILKHQCGIEMETIVDHFSEALSSKYTARYPLIDNEQEILNDFFNFEVHPMYPKELNPHSNTKFYAFTCKKK